MLIPFLIALSLNFDTFSVSVVEGSRVRKPVFPTTFKVAFVFGSVQGLFALLGAVLGLGFKTIVANTDHWIAFILLCLIGGKLIRESFGKPDCTSKLQKSDIRSIVVLAVATSIDSLIVGITIAFLQDKIALYTVIIGLVTFAVSFIGYRCGRGLKKICGNNARIIGGIILIAIGIKTLIQHLYFGG